MVKREDCPVHGPLDIQAQINSLDSCQARAVNKVVGATVLTAGSIGLIVGLVIAWIITLLG